MAIDQNHTGDTNPAAQRPPMDPKREELRLAVRYFYDLQKLRIASGNRTADPDAYKIVSDGKGGEKKVKKATTKGAMDAALQEVLKSLQGSKDAVEPEPEPETSKKERPAPPIITEDGRVYLSRQNLVLQSLEADILNYIRALLKQVPIAEWILEQKGIGPTLAGVLISEIDITRCNTVSQLWAYAGLHIDVETGSAKRRKRGEKANWNSFLKTKTVKILAECFIKCRSPWRAHYDSYKMRKVNELVPVCQLCNGAGKITAKEEAEVQGKELEGADTGRTKKCSNCGGTGGPAPWGRSNAHRDLAAKRYMAKMFLQQLWIKWRTLEGLPVTPSYAEAMLNRHHGDHGGSRVQEYRPAPRGRSVQHPWPSG